ncbi:MAG: hypothetical protein ACXVHS_11335, partial [Methanobacterium sp.]
GCNKAYEEFLGLKKEYIVGKSVYDIFPKDQADKYYEKDLELFQIPGKRFMNGKWIMLTEAYIALFSIKLLI